MKESFCTHTKHLFAEKELHEFFGEFLTEEINNKFKEDWHYDYIKEMLESHDINKLSSKIQSLYNVKIDKLNSSENELDIISVTFKDSDDLDAFLKDQKIKNALHYFNYFITKAFKEKLQVFIEPSFSKEISDEEFEACHGVFFHITSKHNALKILSHGLIPKASLEDNYRYFPERAYIVGLKSFKDADSKLKEIAELTNEHPENCAILKINLNRNYVRVFKDLAMNERDDCYFVYSRIWKGCISFYKDYNDLMVP